MDCLVNEAELDHIVRVNHKNSRDRYVKTLCGNRCFYDFCRFSKSEYSKLLEVVKVWETKECSICALRALELGTC